MSGPDPIVVGEINADDSSLEKTLTEKQWEAIRDQRNQLIKFKFMSITFGCLNGAMVLIVLIGIGFDQWNLSYQSANFKLADRFISSGVINALIAATVAQAGLAFITITKFLFPSGDKN